MRDERFAVSLERASYGDEQNDFVYKNFLTTIMS